MEHAFADLPSDDLEQVTKPEAKPTPLTVALTELLSEETKTVRYSLLSSFVSSLNLQLVTRCREAIREQVRERNDRKADDDATPSIDERNEAEDAAGINAGCYGAGDVDEANANYAGNRLPMKASQVVQRLGIIRAYCHEQQEAIRSNNVIPFVPRPLSESIDWLRSQLPTSTLPTHPAVLVAMQLTGMTAEQCVAVRNAGHASERAELEAMAKEMELMGESATDKFKPDAIAVEEAFDSLPPQIKANVYISAINACVSCYNSAFKKVVMRGDAAAAGDMVIAKSLYERGLTTLKQLCLKHAAELGEFEARGGLLKEIKRIG